MNVALRMCWRELGTDGRGDDGVRREDAVQSAEDDSLHTVATALVTLRRYLDSHGRWVVHAAVSALHVASSSNQGSGWALSGAAAPWEVRELPELPGAPKEARMPSLGTAEGGVLTLQHYSGCVRCLAGLGVALLVCVACRGEVTPVEQVLAEVGGRSHTCPRARALPRWPWLRQLLTTPLTTPKFRRITRQRRHAHKLVSLTN